MYISYSNAVAGVLDPSSCATVFDMLSFVSIDESERGSLVMECSGLSAWDGGVNGETRGWLFRRV